MTIRNREINRRLSDLEACALEAPEGTYELAKATADAISDIANHIMSRLSEAGLKVSGDDNLRNVEVAIYEYVLANNPTALASAEGFGEAMAEPHADRVIAGAIRDRDALRSMGIIQ